uniref:Uncharacterized protein n=1 Tax=Ornithorhynchus anatinus TaxID=9258 RepID=A0A6I8PCM9_ORNAN
MPTSPCPCHGPSANPHTCLTESPPSPGGREEKKSTRQRPVNGFWGIALGRSAAWRIFTVSPCWLCRGLQLFQDRALFFNFFDLILCRSSVKVEGNPAGQRGILGRPERESGVAEAAAEQRACGRGLQRQCTDRHGTTVLMVASYAGHIQCVRELVLQGADINLQRESGTTALFFAAQQGHNDVVCFLFQFGASTEFRTKDGGSALLAASQYGHRQVVETLLKHGANIHDQLYDGATALFLAAQGGYLDVIRLLLSSGAKVNQTRQDGTAPLWIASQMGHSEVVRVMLLRGADRDAARTDGTTALLKAANKGYNDVIEELLKFSPTLGILKVSRDDLGARTLRERSVGPSWRRSEAQWKEPRAGSQRTWILILASPFACCVTLGNHFTSVGLSFLICKMGTRCRSPSPADCELETESEPVILGVPQ